MAITRWILLQTAAAGTQLERTAASPRRTALLPRQLSENRPGPGDTDRAHRLVIDFGSGEISSFEPTDVGQVTAGRGGARRGMRNDGLCAVQISAAVADLVS